MCGKLYRKSFLDSVPIQPSKLTLGEDLYFNLILFPYLKKIKIVDYIGYNYRFGGMTTKYNPYLLPNLETLYKIKMGLAEKYKYSKAIPYLLIEMKNIIKSDIKQQMVFKVSNRKEIINNLKKLFCSPHVLNDVYLYYKEENLKDTTSFVVALREKNFEKMYLSCLEEVVSERKKRVFYSFFSFILKYV